MRVGTIGYATDQGLGILTKAFIDHGVIDDILVVKHAHHRTHEDWYTNRNQRQTHAVHLDSNLMCDFCAEHDVMFFIETPFLWSLLPFCREHGVKTVLMPMHECTPDPIPAEPDLYINPSALDQRCFQNGVQLTVPTDVPWRLRKQALTYVHNAGHLGLRGRNGTLELFQAMEHVKSPLKLILRGQDQQTLDVIRQVPLAAKDSRIDVRIGNFAHDQLWDEGDVFVFPEKFNGLSLPLQEAHAAGMLVMATDRFPMNTWLPLGPLVEPRGYSEVSVGGPYRKFQGAQISPYDIAVMMDRWYGEDITQHSQQGKLYAEQNTWAHWAPIYRSKLEEITCASST